MIQLTERGHDVWKIVTPTVLAKAREQFGCASLNGAEIENQGGSGTAGSHWEKRIFMNEYMSGVSTGLRPDYTTLTFGLFEDMGWYYVNWDSSHITVGTWLRNAGCPAVTDKCLTPGSSPAVVSGGAGFFCNNVDDNGCTSDRSAKGYCNLNSNGQTNGAAVQWSSLDAWYQYWSDGTTGGSIQVADFCPYRSPFSNGKCVDTTNTAGSRKDIFSSTSLCFDSTVGGSSTVAAACYQYSCSSSGVLSVTVGTSPTTTVTCSSNAQMSVSG